MSQRVQFIGWFCLVTLGAMVLCVIAHRAIVFEWNRQQLSELATQTVTRTDIAIDRAVIAMGELIEAGHTRCEDRAVAAIRTAVFRTGGIRDIEIRHDGRMCRAFADSGVSAGADDGAEDWRPARNGRIALAQIVDDGGEHLGVQWKLGPDRAIVAILNTEALIFDVLPQAVRDGSSIALDIDGDHRVASKREGAFDADARQVFASPSARYPTTARIEVADATFAAWRTRPSLTMAAIALALSLAFGFATARAATGRRGFADDFRAAMACGEIMPHYQPIVSLADGRPIGFEILARWRRGDGTFISPAQFIPLVELNDCADALVAHLMRRARAELGPTLSAHGGLKLAVNIAPAQFERIGFADWFTRLIDETGLARSCIVVEVTERQPLTSMQAGQATTDALRKAGFDVALDDAGTGHNGLAVMKSMLANRIKIDKMFIDEIDNDFRTRALVEMLVQVARELGMAIVAEGIERHEQAVILKSLGIEHGQGFWFAKPMPADDAVAYLRRNAVRGTSPARKAPGRTDIAA